MWFLSLLTGLLKIIFILIAIILTIIAVLIFVPICYDVFIGKSGAFHIEASASWFFRGLKLNYEKSPKKTSMKLSVFGKIINRGKKKKKKKSELRKTKEIEETIETQTADNTSNIIGETEAAQTVEEKSTKNEKNIKKETTEDIEETEETDESLLKKAAFLYNHPDRDVLIRLTLRLCRELLLALKPEKFLLNAEVGTGAPDVTGYLIGLIESAKPFLGVDISIRGNFENPALSGDMSIKGKLYLYKFVWPLCKYAFAKPVWKLIKKYFFKKDDEK